MGRLVSLTFLLASDMCTGFTDTGVVRTSEIWQVTPEQHRQHWVGVGVTGRTAGVGATQGSDLCAGGTGCAASLGLCLPEAAGGKEHRPVSMLRTALCCPL